MAEKKEHTFPVGGLWETSAWGLVENQVFQPEGPLCAHAEQLPDEVHDQGNGRTYKRKQARVPFAIVAKNEGGYASTGVCGLCVIETIKEKGTT